MLPSRLFWLFYKHIFLTRLVIYNDVSAPSQNAVMVTGEEGISILFYGKPTKCEWALLKRNKLKNFLKCQKKRNIIFLKNIIILMEKLY